MKRLIVTVIMLVVFIGGLCYTGSPAYSAETKRLVKPADLVYRGAFRLPDGPEEFAWAWSGEGMAYYPGGDAKGLRDGYPGSIFGVGHNWHQFVSEISIPAPVVSVTKNLSKLNKAKSLQEFKDIKGGLFAEYEQPRAGLAFLGAQGKQKTGKLYFCWAQHLHEGHTGPSHGWCELDLSNPKSAGPWRIGEHENYITADYIFTIPKEWADANAQGMRLATGRYRDGGQGAQGPALFAYGPWKDGNPPAKGASVKAVTLLLYSNVTEENQIKMKNYHHADEWSGGAWLTAGSKSAVVFVGTKGIGKCWYGFANGVVWPEEGPFPKIPAPPHDERGWWSSAFSGQIIFYDPQDLGAVAKGRKKSSAPQPYGVLEIDKHLFGVKSKQQKSHLGGACFDRKRGLLYVFELRADEDKCIVHAWQVK